MMRKLNLNKCRKLILLIVLILVNYIPTMACEACNKNQPKILRGITHGNGPQSNWDYFVVIIMVLVTLYSLYAAIKCFVKPSEKKYNDIKNTILNQQ